MRQIYDCQNNSVKELIYFRLKDNLTTEEAEAIVESEYNRFKATHNPPPPQAILSNEQDQSRVMMGDCGFSAVASLEWRAKDCIMEDMVNFVEESTLFSTFPSFEGNIQDLRIFSAGFTCGFLDGIIDLLALSANINEFSVNAVLAFSPTKIVFDFFKKARKERSFRRAIFKLSEEYSEEVKGYALIGYQVFKFLESLYNFNSQTPASYGLIWGIIQNVVGAVITEIGNLTFQNGNLAAAYAWGVQVFNIVFDLLTFGFGKAAKLGKSAIKILEEIANSKLDNLANLIHDGMNSVKVSNWKKTLCKIGFGNGCFIAGTPVWTAAGLMPINNMPPINGQLVNFEILQALTPKIGLYIKE